LRSGIENAKTNKNTTIKQSTDKDTMILSGFPIWVHPLAAAAELSSSIVVTNVPRG